MKIVVFVFGLICLVGASTCAVMMYLKAIRTGGRRESILRLAQNESRPAIFAIAFSIGLALALLAMRLNLV